MDVILAVEQGFYICFFVINAYIFPHTFSGFGRTKTLNQLLTQQKMINPQNVSKQKEKTGLSLFMSPRLSSVMYFLCFHYLHVMFLCYASCSLYLKLCVPCLCQQLVYIRSVSEGRKAVKCFNHLKIL